MDGNLVDRIKHWLTPARGLPVLAAESTAPCLKSGFRLYIFDIDRLSLGLLDTRTRQASYERLRERLLPNLRLRIDSRDVEEIDARCQELLLSPSASVRWLTAAGRRRQEAAFSFLYLPFLITLDGCCLSSGRIVPACSQGSSRQPRAHPAHGSSRLHLSFPAAPADLEPGAEWPSQALALCRC